MGESRGHEGGPGHQCPVEVREGAGAGKLSTRQWLTSCKSSFTESRAGSSTLRSLETGTKDKGSRRRTIVPAGWQVKKELIRIQWDNGLEVQMS